jgi:DNA-cytosine methyltransferase
MKKRTLKFADLFCGCGGFSYGFHARKCFEGILAVDYWKAAEPTYTHNLPHIPFLVRDLHKEKSQKEIIKLLRGSCDVLLGGPPCQGFSTLGKRRSNDQRSALIDVFLRIALKVEPKVIVLENVRGIISMLHSSGATYADHLFKTLTDGNGHRQYHIYASPINALNYGIPQNRIRWILVAIRTDLPNALSKLEAIKKGLQPLTPNKNLTLQNAIGDLPNIRAGEGADEIVLTNGKPSHTRVMFNHRAMNHSPELVQRLSHVPPGGGLLNVPRKLLTPHLCKMLDGAYGNGGHPKNIYGRMEWNKPSGTIVAGIDKITCGRFVHPNADRLLTPRECARIQSFPDSFRFFGGLVTNYYLIGNAVPPSLSEIIASTIEAALVANKKQRPNKQANQSK